MADFFGNYEGITGEGDEEAQKPPLSSSESSLSSSSEPPEPPAVEGPEGAFVSLPVELKVAILSTVKLNHRLAFHQVSHQFRDVLSLSLADLDVEGFSSSFVGEALATRQFRAAHVVSISLLGHLLDSTLRPINLHHLSGQNPLNLTSLNLCRTFLNPRQAAALGHLQSLTSLNLRYTRIGDESMPTIAKLTRLRRLYIRYAFVGGVSTPATPDITQGDEKWLADPKKPFPTVWEEGGVLTDAGMVALASLTSLTDLEYSPGARYSDLVFGKNLSSLRALPNLTSLAMTSTDIPTATWATFLAGRPLPLLSTLDLSWSWRVIVADYRLLDSLAANYQLRKVHIQGCDLATFPNCARNGPIHPADVGLFKRFPNLDFNLDFVLYE